MYTKVFSEFEVKETGIRVLDEADSTAERIGCVGSVEETKNVKVVEKKCEGVVTKKIVRGDGTGTAKYSLHMRHDLYAKTFGMLIENHKEGVISYGRLSKHKNVCITSKVLDEDGNVKFKAYPNAIIENGDTRKIENGAEEVAEIELELSLLPDEYGQCLYEALENELADEELKNAWMTKFDSGATYVTTA